MHFPAENWKSGIIYQKPQSFQFFQAFIADQASKLIPLYFKGFARMV
jgi:hypothetical protein